MVVEKYTGTGRLHVDLSLDLGRSVYEVGPEKGKHFILLNLHGKTDSRMGVVESV